jgi:UDP-hydrolysing UDP-N-acetyl-D-glucosamine 2-epimerase
MRTIGVVTTSRADWSITSAIARAIRQDARLRLRLYVTGTHLDANFGTTATQIEADGYEIGERLPIEIESDTPEAISLMMASATAAFSKSFARHRPDLLVVTGDRFEMHGAAVAALPFNIPLAHVHGGEITLGAVDESLRHSLTKLSHLHFVSCEEYARRVMQMGEEQWRVCVSGAPALDHLIDLQVASKDELKAKYSFDFERPFLMVTFHPVTLEPDSAREHVAELLMALDEIAMPALITAPNCDTNQNTIRNSLQKFVSGNPDRRLVENFGTRDYFSVMTYASATVGNSSSGIVEAASFGLAVVNVGSRQEGRARSGNVIDVGYRRPEIVAGVRAALRPGFRKQLQAGKNIYGDGHASEKIAAGMATVELGDRLLKKRFNDVDQETIARV